MNMLRTLRLTLQLADYFRVSVGFSRQRRRDHSYTIRLDPPGQLGPVESSRVELNRIGRCDHTFTRMGNP